MQWKAYLAKEKETSRYARQYKWKPSLTIPTTSRLKKAKRKTTSAFFQLKIGHGYIKDYLYRIRKSSNDRCKCGRRETTNHLLLECKEYTEARTSLRLKLDPLQLHLPLLLHTDVGIFSTLEFLERTGTATRQWHLQRNAEEEA